MTHPDDVALTCARAEALAHSVLESASVRGLPVSVAVVDPRGFDLIVLRGDGATWFTPEVARAKARTAASFGRPSASLVTMRTAYPDLFDLVSATLPFSATTLPGGLPIEVDGQLIGGLGVSGAQPAEDVDLAQAALIAVLGATNSS